MKKDLLTVAYWLICCTIILGAIIPLKVFFKSKYYYQWLKCGFSENVQVFFSQFTKNIRKIFNLKIEIKLHALFLRLALCKYIKGKHFFKSKCDRFYRNISVNLLIFFAILTIIDIPTVKSKQNIISIPNLKVNFEAFLLS